VHILAFDVLIATLDVFINHAFDRPIDYMRVVHHLLSIVSELIVSRLHESYIQHSPLPQLQMLRDFKVQ